MSHIVELDPVLREVRDGLAARGFEVRSNAYFGGPGLLAFVRSEPQHPPRGARLEERHIPVIENGVFVYPRDDSWQARVTHHGGPHLVRTASSASDLLALALSVLRAESKFDDWREEP